jgi:zinc protease
MTIKQLKSWPLIMMVCLLAGLCGQARMASAVDDPLPRDPNNVYGTFDNGVNYIIRHASNPPGKVSLDLHVRTGALNETDRQNGLAHFLEHMAFKGSSHFEPMKLIPLLSHLGMTFGADTNAHTNLQETVFKLSMPDTQPKTIDLALTIFSDYASALSLYPIQIESERRVILEESRMRKSASQRLQKELNRQMFGDTQLGVHDVIGDEELIKTFPASEFTDYWNTWYRPENMTLIVVGDIDPSTVIAQAKDKLGSFTARAPAREPMKAGIKPFESPRAFVLTDPEQVTAEVSLLGMSPSRGKTQTVSQLQREVVEQLAEWIVNRRLKDSITRGDAPFRDASVDSGDILHEGFQVSAGAEGEPKDWNRMLDALVGEIHSAIDHGFTTQEFDLATRGLLASEQQRVDTESTQDSKEVVGRLASLVGSSRPILSAQQNLDLIRQILSSLTKEDLWKEFKEDFDTRHYAYVVMLPASKDPSSIPSNSDVLAAATAAWGKESKVVEEASSETTILAAEPTPGTVKSREVDDQLGITTVVFENGVVLHHKFTDYKKDQVAIRITLPGGVIEETAQNKGISSLASQVIGQAATHRLSSTQLRDLMTGKNVSVTGGIGLDSLAMSINGSPADLPQGLQLANALLTEGILEQSAVDEWRRAQLSTLKEKPTSGKAQLADAFSQTLGAGDVRLAPLTTEVVNRLQREEAEQWFTRIARNAAIEVVVVGDMQSDRAIELIGRYLGSLPKRTGTFTDLDSLRKLDRKPGPFAKTVEFSAVTPAAIVLAGYVGCDESNLDRRPLAMGCAILTERMIQRIRMKDNLVYSIRCSSTPGQGLPGMGEIVAAAPTDPKNADRLASTILEMMQSFADTGPTEQEMATAKKQIANTLQTQMKDPGFWIAQLAEFQYHRHSLAELKQVPAIFETFTADDIRNVFKKYVNDGGQIRLEAVPQSTTVGPTTNPASAAAMQGNSLIAHQGNP